MERPFRTTLQGIEAIVFAKSAGRAKYVTALSAHDAGYIKKPNPALVQCRRAFEHDGKFGFKTDHCYAPEYFCDDTEGKR